MFYNCIAFPIYLFLFPKIASCEFKILNRSKIVKYLVDISYVFFLSQLFTWDVTKYLLGIFGNSIDVPLWTMIIISLPICLILSIFIHHCIEKPITGFIKRKLL